MRFLLAAICASAPASIGLTPLPSSLPIFLLLRLLRVRFVVGFPPRFNRLPGDFLPLFWSQRRGPGLTHTAGPFLGCKLFLCHSPLVYTSCKNFTSGKQISLDFYTCSKYNLIWMEVLMNATCPNCSTLFRGVDRNEDGAPGIPDTLKCAEEDCER